MSEPCPPSAPAPSHPVDALCQSAAFRDAVIGMAVLDDDFTLLRVNARLAADLGYEAAQMEGLPPERFTHPEDIPRLKEHVARTLAAGEAPAPLRKRCLRSDGSAMPILAHVSALPGGRWLAQIEDLRAVDQLAQERRMFQAGPVVGFRWIAAPGWPVEYVSQNLEAAFGWRAEDLLSGALAYADLMHPDDVEPIAAELRRHEEAGCDAFVQTYRIRTRGGDWRWVRDFQNVRRDASGRVTHYEGYILDDTARVEAERAMAARAADRERLLRFSRRLLTVRSYEALAEAVCEDLAERIGVRHAYLYVAERSQPSLPRLLAGAGPGRAAVYQHAGEVDLAASPLFRAALASDEPTYVRDVAQDGRMNPQRAAALAARSLLGAPLYRDGEVTCALWTGTLGDEGTLDLTPDDLEYFRNLTSVAGLAFGRIRADQEGRAAQARLRQVEKLEAVGQLAGGVAHNFNNALTVILGHASLLLDAAPDVSFRAGLEAILRAGEGSAHAVRQLLQFARPAAADPLQRIEPARSLAEFGKMLRAVLDESIQLRIEADPELPEVEIEGGGLTMILMNLVLNARDAMGGRGRLTLRARAEGTGSDRRLRLEVEDDGCGMDAALQARIFEPFFTTKGDLGTGLGLPAVYGAITRAGGTIEVQSSPGRGARFTVRLPAAAPRPPEVAETRSAEPGRGRRILVVEDEDAVRTLAVRALSFQGYRVEGVASGSAALDRMKRAEPFDLVVSDVVMHGMDGVVLAEALARLPHPPRVLLMSGYPGEGRMQTLPPGVHGLLGKPFSAQELALAVQRAMEDAPDAAARQRSGNAD